MRASRQHDVHGVTPLILGEVLNGHHFDFVALGADALHDPFSGPFRQFIILAGGEGDGGKHEAETDAQGAGGGVAIRSKRHDSFPSGSPGRIPQPAFPKALPLTGGPAGFPTDPRLP
jgi:hypothetical protein